MSGRSGEDRRVQYTKMFLREALFDLMKEKPVGKITPTELCRRANVNRNTFYAHYASPEALLESIENELFAAIGASLESSRRTGRRLELLTEICQAIRNNADLCTSILSDHGDPDFLLRLVDMARDQALAEWKELGVDADSDALKLLYAFSALGSVGLIRAWIETGMQRTPEEIARLLDSATMSGLTAFLPRK